MADDHKPTKGKAAMRRMHEAILRSGALCRVGSEGRLVFCYATCWADYGSCTFTFSARGAAKVMGGHITTFTRGIRQLEEAGVIAKGPRTKAGRTRFVFRCPTQEGAHEVCQGAHTGRERKRTQGVLGAHTGRVQGAHEACQGAHTRRGPYPEYVPSDPSRDQKGNQKALAASAAGAAATARVTGTQETNQ